MERAGLGNAIIDKLKEGKRREEAPSWRNENTRYEMENRRKSQDKRKGEKIEKDGSTIERKEVMYRGRRQEKRKEEKKRVNSGVGRENED